jgi:hypothetical protein
MDVKQENPPDKAGRDLEAMLAITADEATRVLLSPSWRCSFLRRRVQMNDIGVCADTRQLGLQRRIPCRPLEAKRTVDWHRFNVWKNTKGFGPSCSCSPESHGQALLEDFQTASVHIQLQNRTEATPSFLLAGDLLLFESLGGYESFVSVRQGLSNTQSLRHEHIFDMMELLVLPLTDAGSSERPRFLLESYGVSRWCEDYFDMWSLIPPCVNTL